MDELRDALELANEDELRELTELLFRAKFNPVDYVKLPLPETIQALPRRAQLDALEQRFRFLAADGLTVLRGEARLMSYRETLERVCRYLKIDAAQNLGPDCFTDELEAEVFLRVLQQGLQRLPERDRAQISREVNRQINRHLRHQTPELGLNRLVDPDPLRLVLEGSSALAVSSVVRPLVLRLLARQFALQLARYQMAQVAVQQGSGFLAQLQGRAALHMARRGVVLSTARYTAARSVLAFVGPAMWAWFLADLGWRTIATNYGRIIPAIFLLAQIRLTRADTPAATAF